MPPFRASHAGGSSVNNRHSQVLKLTIPVLEGEAYRSAREKFWLALRALGLSQVDATLATAEFSQLYRQLTAGTGVDLSVLLDGTQATLKLQVPITPRSNPPQPELGHFHHKAAHHAPTAENEQPRTQLEWYRLYPLQKPADLHEVRRCLEGSSSEEILVQASRTAAALTSTQSRLSSVQEDLRIAADIQQRMLVSKQQLERVSPWLDCHAYMLPCRDIGGDFYDLIRLDADHVAVVIGDVSGKGISAAMMMATCITLLRAYTESFRSASRIMRKVNPRLIDGNEQDCMFTTLFLGIMNCHRNTFTYCNAGHNPILLQRKDGRVIHLDDIHGPAVGVFKNVEYDETRVPVYSGDRLLLYTDGASETFNNAGDLYGDARLSDFYRRAPMHVSSQRLIANLLHDLARFSGEEQPHDDVTLVCVRRLDNPEHDLATLLDERTADPSGMAELMRQAEQFCREHGISEEITGRLQLVLDELLINVVSYGSEDSDSTARVSLSLRLQSKLLVVELRDTGRPFNPFALAEPDTDLSIEERELGGLGVFMVRTLTQSFSYNYEEPYNFVRLEIDCSASGGAQEVR